jgi:hypothetical protein
MGQVKRFAKGIAQCFPEQEKVLASVPRFRRVILVAICSPRLARVAVICSHRSHAPGPRFEIVCLRALHLERYEPPELARSLCARPSGEGPARIPEICARARRLIQNRQLELATFSRIHDDEIAEVEAALRDLWVIEQKK